MTKSLSYVLIAAMLPAFALSAKAAALIDLGMGLPTAQDEDASSLDPEDVLGAAESIHMSRDDVPQGAPSSSEISDPGQVKSASDLSSYAQALFRSDKDIESLEFIPSRVTVGYQGKGKFLGLVDVSYPLDVSVFLDGHAEVDYPWFDFAVAKGDKSVIADPVSQGTASLVGSGQGAFSPNQEAEIAANVIKALKVRLQKM